MNEDEDEDELPVLRPPPPSRRGGAGRAGLLGLFFVLALAGTAYVSYELGRGPRLNEEGVVIDPPAPQPSAPEAGEDEEGLSALLREIALARACERLEGSFLPLPPDESEDSHLAAGRMWVERCRLEERPGQLHASVQGRGFRYLARSAAGPLGSSFSTRGYLRFEVRLELGLAMSLGYRRESRELLLRLASVGTPAASLRAIGSLPVRAEGGWSSMIGGLGGLLGGGSLSTRAQQAVEEQGSALLTSRARRGATLRLDLCAGQLDVDLRGERRAAPPPFPDDGRSWLANTRGLIYAGGLDLLGPFVGKQLEAELELEQGQAAEVVAVCEEEARGIAASFLASQRGGRPRSPQARLALRRGAQARLLFSSEPCPGGAALIVYPPERSEDLIRYRARVREEGAGHPNWVRCPN